MALSGSSIGLPNTRLKLRALPQAPVSVYTVAKEMGHGGESMVRRVYGHLGQVRQRPDVVEYRVEQYIANLGDRLARLHSDTMVDTTAVDSQPSRATRLAVTPRA